MIDVGILVSPHQGGDVYPLTTDFLYQIAHNAKAGQYLQRIR